MDIKSIINISLVSMRANKVRTALTVLGVVIGIASVIVVYAAGEGIRGLIFGQIESFGGTDIIETEIKVPTGKKGTAAEQQSATAIAQGVQITTLTLEDMEDVKKLPNIKNGYGAILAQEQANYGNETIKSFIFGVSASAIEIDQTEIDYGRWFTEEEDRALAPVAVLGSEIKDKLFGDGDPIGRYIKIRKTKFHVIGVVKERGAVMTLDFDQFIYLPVRTLQKRVMGIDHILFMFHQLAEPSRSEETAEEMRYIIRQNHDLESVAVEYRPGQEAVKTIGEGSTDTSKDDFRVVSMKESMEVMDTVMGAVTLLLLAIVAISLLVGGVGIMNIMYVSVTERTAEIGLRKAVGAKYSDILKQFLIEAIIVTLAGGIAGVVLGILISALIAWGAKSFGLDWKFLVPLKAFVVSLGFSAAFGLIFGVYPARKAARLDPIVALRNE